MNYFHILTIILALLIFESTLITHASTDNNKINQINKIIQFIDEPYRNGYEKEKIKSIIDSINYNINSDGRENLHDLLQEAKNIYENYTKIKYFYILKKIVYYLLLFATPIILYKGLDYTICFIYILQKKVKNYAQRRS